MHPSYLAAAATGPDWSIFGQYGVVGAIAVGLILFAKRAVEREQARADRLESEVKRLNDVIVEKVIPAMSAASRAAEESANLLSAMQRERELNQLAVDRDRRATKRREDGNP